MARRKLAASRRTTLVPRTVYVRIAPEVANNLTKFARVQKDLLGRLGCRACTSGMDIRWIQEEIFSVNAQGRIQELTGPLG